MFDIAQITPELAAHRFIALSPTMREAMLSEENMKATDLIFKNHQLSEESILLAQQLIGLTMLGFIQPNELADVISSELTIDTQKANQIASELFLKLPFLKTELRSGGAPDMSDIRPRVVTPESPARPKIQVPSGPMVIHTQTSVAPIPSNIAPPDLSRDSGFQNKVESFFAKKAPAPAPQFARIQSQGNQTSPSMNMPKPTMEVPRVVHYGELKTILGTAPTTPAPSGSKPAPLPLSKIGVTAPSRAPMPTPPAPAPKPTPAPSPIPATPPKASLAPLPGVKGVPPPPPKPPIPPLPR